MVSREIIKPVLIILSFFIIFNCISNNFSMADLDDKINIPSKFPRTSLIANSIHIDNNWTETKAVYDWCTGSGLYTDPYVIKDLVINGAGLETCILIENSAFYFRIENCTLYNSGLGNYTSNDYKAGIKLVNTRNGKIIDNNCSGNNGVGIMLSNGCNYNTISRNNVSNNEQYGIFLYKTCFNNLISQNNVSVNHFCGINLTKDCNYNNILKNNISENNIGITIFNECFDNTIFENKVENNNKSGIEVNYFCDYNIFSENNISKNCNCGLNITVNCSYNLVYNNSFNRNLKNAVDDGTNNNWNSSLIGNYWSNYMEIDWNDDGIGDTPFEIWGSAGSKDFLPIWDDGYKIPLFICLIITGLITLGVLGTAICVLFKKKVIRDKKITYISMLLIILILFFLISII